METFKIWDITCAHAKSMSSDFLVPKKVNWARNIPDTDVTFYTDCNLADHRILDIKNSRAKKKIAWIIEPAIINPSPYRWIKDNYRLFDKVITHHKYLLALDPRFVYCPAGGCWIQEESWRHTGPRSGNICQIVSWKLMTPMQHFRHDVMMLFGQKYGIDGYGETFNRKVKFKREILCNYKYSIVIENCAEPGYFTEKLLDCIASYCAPIYYGDPDIGQIFDIPTFKTMDELENILKNLLPINPTLLEKNYKAGEQYFLIDDWVYDNVICKL
jgi:hypothetical protein